MASVTGGINVVALSTKIAAQAGGQALLSVGVPGGAALIEALLGSFLHVQDDQAKALSRIDRKVQLLLAQPVRTARMYIEEASLPGSAAEQKRAKLLEAASELRRAIPLQPDRTFARAYTSLDLAIVLMMLGDSAAAAYYAEHAIEAAAGYLLDAGFSQGRPPKPPTTTATERLSWLRDVESQYDELCTASAPLGVVWWAKPRGELGAGT
jgi:tetratricopeptide (TPR) repeat protein